jgi:hypothetical protein
VTNSANTTERRQGRRVDIDGAIECRLDLRTRVRLIDISLSGALLAADVALPVGESARLRSPLGGGTLQSDVQVKRKVGLRAEAALNGLGASFTEMDPLSRRNLEEFLRKASH